MIKKVLIFILFLTLKLTNLNASTGILKTSSMVECDGVLYGFHGPDKHYHIAEETSDGKYKAKGESLGTTIPCQKEVKSLSSSKELEKVTVTFDSCVDGDTANFIVNGKKTKFRFLAIDTPETVHPTKGVEKFGKNASEYTCNKLTNASLIEIEYEENKTDKYGRSLGWIWVDGSLLQDELVKYGYAEVAYIYSAYKYTSELCETQKNAILNNYGIWENKSRKEGYCSTIRIVERKVNENNEETNSNLKKENKNKSSEKKEYTKETIIGFIILLMAVGLKKVGKKI